MFIHGTRQAAGPGCLLLAALWLAGCGNGGQEPGAPAPGSPTGEQAAGSAPEQPAARIEALADSYLAAMLERYPETPTYYGLEGFPHGRLTDNSQAALDRWQGRMDAWLADLKAIPQPVPGEAGWALYGLLRETLEGAIAYRPCQVHLWNVSQMTGWQSFIPMLAELQPIGAEPARAQSVGRARDLVRYLDTEIVNLRAGLEAGYSAPARNVEIVIGQVRALRDSGSPLSSPALRDTDPAFRDAYLEVLSAEVYPALDRYADYLEGEYLPATRSTIAVSAHPGGADCYRGAVRYYATMDMDPEQIHAIGLDQMQKLRAEMEAIAQRSFHSDDLTALFRTLTGDPQYTFRYAGEMKSAAEAALSRANAVLPSWLGIIPRAKVVIEPYPAYREGSAWGEYQSASADGSRPGIFYLPLHDPQHYPRASLEALTFHETVPGHHLQGSISLELEDSHELARYTYNSGYGEGWALYSERLADEMELYSSDLARLGMFSSQAARAARLVVDTGMHIKGWSREQAIDYMRANTSWSPAEIESEVDRYIIWPGQATAYMLGALEITRLRSQAMTTLGERFDIRGFHDTVLRNGSISLAMLGQAVQQWVKKTGEVGLADATPAATAPEADPAPGR